MCVVLASEQIELFNPNTYLLFILSMFFFVAYVCTCVQTGKFSNMVDSLGRGTIAALAQGGPKARVSAIWGMLLDLRRISYAT